MINKANEMNVMLLITDDFTFYSLPFVYSLIINNNWAKLNFFILTDNMSRENRKTLCDMIKSWGAELDIIDVDTSIFNGLKANWRYPSLLYCKLLPHNYLPNNLDRAIYFDVDMVVTGSLESLYKTDMGEAYFGGCYDVNRFHKVFNGTAQGIDKTYINSGMVLYNLDKLRKANVCLPDYTEFLKNNVQRLYEEWLLCNTFPDKIYNFYPFDYNYNPGERNFYKEFCKSTGIEEKKLVIHYMSFGNDSPIVRPWEAFDCFFYNNDNKTFKSDLYEIYKLWWDCAKKMPYLILNTIILQAQKQKIQRDLEFEKKTLQQEKEERQKTIDKKQKEILEKDLKITLIESSYSYKIGRMLTYIPRKIQKLFKKKCQK